MYIFGVRYRQKELFHFLSPKKKLIKDRTKVFYFEELNPYRLRESRTTNP